MEILGIDIGGSGLKASIVEIESGKLITERERIPTPRPANPDSVAKTVSKLVKKFDWSGPVGCGFPAVVQNGIVRTASNIDKSWIGTDVKTLFQERTGRPFCVINDADAAGIAEMTFGAGKNKNGSVVIITVGTGIGSSFFIEGQLFPNTEFGQFQMNGKIAEKYAADATRKEMNLSWKKWGKRFNDYLQHLHFLLWPDLIILGGGISKKFEKYSQFLHINTEIVPAQLLNDAGIIGAAVAARDCKVA
ncbi:MAG: ROK family protein [Calditrichia bacterium]|nr:ROK family protein [Calditrichia bacterium]